MSKVQLFITVLPLLGAVFSFVFRGQAEKMKIIALGTTLSTLLALLVLLPGNVHFLIMPLMVFLPLSAALTLLASFSHEITPGDLPILLILLGLGLGYMMHDGEIGLSCLAGVLGIMIFLLSRQNRRSRFSGKWAIALYGLALAALIASLILSPSSGGAPLLITYAVLFPVFPFHGAYVVTSGHLRGVLSGFLFLFLPTLGFKGVLVILHETPTVFIQGLMVFALIGALYGGIRALVQLNGSHRLAYSGFAFWSILWWFLASTGEETAPAVLYFCALALIMQGLFLSWRLLEARHGDLNLEKLGGLARVMPRFGVLLSLLIAAVMGLPLFGLFTALIEMVLSPAIQLSWSFAFILLAWFLASWHFPVLMQQILFGQPKPGRMYRDLARSESLSLTLIVVMTLILGIAPYTLFGVGPFAKQAAPITQASAKIK
ncbi:MAG: proton-conducting transporter membrane subunit [Nitrospiria bacterium]